MSRIDSQMTFNIGAKDRGAAALFAALGKDAKKLAAELDKLSGKGKKGIFADLKGRFGEESTLGNLGKLLTGAGVSAGITMIGRGLDRAASAADDLMMKFQDGNMEASEFSAELLKTIPIVGDLAKGFESVWTLISGSRRELARLEADNQRTIAMMNARDADRSRGSNIFAQLESDFGRRGRDRRIAGADEPVKTMLSAFAKIGDDLAKIDATFASGGGAAMVKELRALREREIKLVSDLKGLPANVLNSPIPLSDLRIIAKQGATNAPTYSAQKQFDAYARANNVSLQDLGGLARRQIGITESRDAVQRELSQVRTDITVKAQSIAPAMKALEKEKLDTLVFAGRSMLEGLGEVFKGWDFKAAAAGVEQKQNDFLKMITDQAVDIASEQADSLSAAVRMTRQQREAQISSKLTELEKQRRDARDSMISPARTGALASGFSIGLAPQLQSMSRASFDPHAQHREVVKKLDQQIEQLKTAVQELRKGNEPATSVFN